MSKDGTEVRDLAMQISRRKIFPDKNSQRKGPSARGCLAVIGAGYWNKVLSRNEVTEVDVD